MRRAATRRGLLSSLGSALAASTAGCVGALRSSIGEPSVDAPEKTLVGEPLPVRISGFPASTTLDVSVKTTDDQGKQCRADTSVSTDEWGSARLELSSLSDSGSPSMALWDVCATGATSELFVAGDSDAFDLRVSVSGPDESERATATRVYTDPAVETEYVEGDIVGRLFVPDVDRENPSDGVVALHGSGGHLSALYPVCRLLATHGYAVLALRYFGHSSLPDTLARVPLEYFERAVDWLRSRERVTDRIALLGLSRGGEAALLAGATLGLEGPVVSYSGSGLVHPGFPNTDQPAWTYRGEPVATPREYRRFQRELHTSGTGTFARLVADLPREIRDPVVIPVEDIQGPVLMLSGLDDTVWTSAPFHRVSRNRLERVGSDHRFALQTFPGAGHVFLTPYGAHGYARGGTLEANAEAAVRSWPQTLSYLGSREPA